MPHLDKRFSVWKQVLPFTFRVFCLSVSLYSSICTHETDPQFIANAVSATLTKTNIPNSFSYYINSLAAESDGSAPPVSKFANKHDPEPAPYTSHRKNLLH